MPKQQPIEIFMPPNMLKAKVGGGQGGIDLSVLKRAELAVDEMKHEFNAWLDEDIVKLEGARYAYQAAPNADAHNALYRTAHDLKGQAATYDFPLIARVAASLCKLCEGFGTAKPMPVSLLDAHVDAIKVIVRDNIRDARDLTTCVLIKELETKVVALLDGTKRPVKA